jgi:hypothetical protein
MAEDQMRRLSRANFEACPSLIRARRSKNIFPALNHRNPLKSLVSGKKTKEKERQ